MTRRQLAWILILIVDAGYIAWGAGAAAAPEHLLGPGSKAIRLGTRASPADRGRS
jgi:hypothetical protein